MNVENNAFIFPPIWLSHKLPTFVHVGTIPNFMVLLLVSETKKNDKLGQKENLKLHALISHEPYLRSLDDSVKIKYWTGLNIW